MREGAGSMDWVLIVGNDTTNVEFAEHTLDKSGIRTGGCLTAYFQPVLFSVTDRSCQEIVQSGGYEKSIPVQFRRRS